jgi:uncharacterized protein (TIGR02391 family)
MPAKSLEVEIATSLCARYLNLHVSTPRKPLAVLVRDAAFKTVEEAVRTRGGANPSNIGVNLITKTMNANAPILKFSDIFAEQEGHVSLYRGAIAVIKNPLSHRKVGHKSKARAFELIAFASTLMRMLDDVPPVQMQL